MGERIAMLLLRKTIAGLRHSKFDKAAWAIINGVATGATYTLRLINLGTADPNVPYAAAGTDLFNGGAGLSFVHGGTPNSQIVIFDLTAGDEVALTPGNTYAFEVVQTAGTGSMTGRRQFDLRRRPVLQGSH
jgi:hypothetical protein